MTDFVFSNLTSGMNIKSYIQRVLRPITVVQANVQNIQPGELLKGKRIVITGGTGGIGKAMAKRFVDEGAKVLITGRNPETLNEVSSCLGCEALVLDVTQVDLFSEFVDQVIAKLGGIDCLVNNAGISLHESFQEVTPAGFDQQVATNFKGPFFLSQEVLSYMEQQGIKGHVLFVSSETGETADIRPYGLTKAAVNSLVKGLAFLYAKKDIRVNAIAPGVTASGMSGFSAKENLFSTFNPSGRVYLPEEMAEVATFLLSDVSYCISGQIITCNNGKTINARWK